MFLDQAVAVVDALEWETGLKSLCKLADMFDQGNKSNGKCEAQAQLLLEHVRAGSQRRALRGFWCYYGCFTVLVYCGKSIKNFIAFRITFFFFLIPVSREDARASAAILGVQGGQMRIQRATPLVTSSQGLTAQWLEIISVYVESRFVLYSCAKSGDGDGEI